jgi:hypothetical protein
VHIRASGAFIDEGALGCPQRHNLVALFTAAFSGADITAAIASR